MVFAEDAEDAALDGDLACGDVNGVHLEVGGLEADGAAFGVVALEGGFRAVDEGDNDFALARGAGAFDEDVVSGNDVLVAHGVAADFECEDVAVADYVVEGDGFGGFVGFDGEAGSDASGEGEAVGGAGAATGGQHLNGAAAVVRAVEHALFFEVGDVLVDGGQAFKAHAAGDFLEGGGISVAVHERIEEVEDFFLATGDGHGRIIANKKRNAIGKVVGGVVSE